MRGRVAVGVADGLALVLAALAIVLTRSDRRLTGSNTRVAASAVELTLAPGQERCQRGEFVPSDTDRVRVFARTVSSGAGRFQILIRSESGEVATGRGTARRPPGPVQVPVSRLDRDAHAATVCIRSQNAALHFAGNLTPHRSFATGRGAGNPGEPGDVVRLDYFREEPQDWLEAIPDVADRIWLFKGPFRGPEAVWAMVLLLVLAWGASLWLLFRETADGRR